MYMKMEPLKEHCKAVTGYTGFSSEEEEQSGHYFPFKLTKTGKKMSLKKNGVAAEGKENMTFDPEIIFESIQRRYMEDRSG